MNASMDRKLIEQRMKNKRDNVSRQLVKLTRISWTSVVADQAGGTTIADLQRAFKQPAQ